MRIGPCVVAVTAVLAPLLAPQPALAYVSGHAADKTTTGSVVVCPSTKCTALAAANTATTGTGSANAVVPVNAVITNANRFHLWAHALRASYVSDNKSCGAGAFQVSGSPLAVNAAVAAQTGGVNGTQTVSGISVKFVGNGSCKSAVVTLAYTVS